MPSIVRSSGSDNASRIAATFPAIRRAFCGAASETSANATLRTLDVRCSICELAADSLRSSNAGRPYPRCTCSISKRAIATDVSEILCTSSAGNESARSAICRGRAASNDDAILLRALLGSMASSSGSRTHGKLSHDTTGHCPCSLRASMLLPSLPFYAF